MRLMLPVIVGVVLETVMNTGTTTAVAMEESALGSERT